MEQARNKVTDQVVDCLDLWVIENVDCNGYVCLGCDLKVVPCSYVQNENKKRPYFKKIKGSEHSESCFMEKSSIPIDSARSSNKPKPQGYPESYPNKLIFEKNENTSLGNNGLRMVRESSSNNQSMEIDVSNDKVHKYSVTTLNSIARKYLQFQNKHEELIKMDLSISNIDGSNYSNVFKFLPRAITELTQRKVWLPD